MPFSNRYSEVTEGIDYEKIQLKLDTFSEVEVYWQKLRDTSLMTPLGKFAFLFEFCKTFSCDKRARKFF